MKKAWTLRYALINISYFAGFCAIHAFASVFLLAAGFTNTQIGINLAVANILSVIVQPVIAGWIDKQGKFTNRNVAMASTMVLVIGALLLLVVRNSIIVIFLIYALIYMLQMAYQPLIIAMYFEYAKAGCNINFGLARGLGSAGFAMTSIYIGRLVERFGVSVLMIEVIVILSFSFIMLLTFKKPIESVDNSATESSEVKMQGVAHNNVIDFAKTYPKFVLFLVGSVCFFFAHNAINDYLIQIIRPLGGNETQMGYAIFIAAILELPTMACIGLLMKKISCMNLLKISGVFFLIKILIILFATNMVGVYISEACQITAYAVFIPASAYYVDLIMEDLDKVKGQAYVNCAVTLGGVFSNVICGPVLDASGPKMMLTIGSVVCAVGVVIAFLSISNKNNA